MYKQALIMGIIMMSSSIMANTSKFIPADSKELEYSDYAIIAFLPNPAKPEFKIARMNRPLFSPGKGYNWDNPGARLRFHTNADNIIVHLIYNDKHISKSARNSIGIFLIDGKSSPGWKFCSNSKSTVRPVERVDLQLPVPKDKKAHTYDIVMPYGDAVDIEGISVNQAAKFDKPRPRPQFRCAIYGDSITHGFTADNIASTYPFKLTQKKNWQLINLGIGGRSSNPQDGSIIGGIKCDLTVVLMGVNDWQGGKPIADYKKNMKLFISNFRQLQNKTPMYFITPLWVPQEWQPKSAKFELEQYRQALREAVKESNDSNLHVIEGPELIDHDKKYFDRVAVHPNDSGFKMMADRIAQKIN